MTEQRTHDVTVTTDGEGRETRTETRTENGKTVEHSSETEAEPKQVKPEGR